MTKYDGVSIPYENSVGKTSAREVKSDPYLRMRCLQLAIDAKVANYLEAAKRFEQYVLGTQSESNNG